MSLNSCNFIGHLGADPVIKQLPNGSDVANFSLGVSESWKDKNTGERKTKTEWIRIVVFGSLVKVVSYLKKGSHIYVSGQMKTSKWTDKDGVEKYSTEIVLQGFNSQLIMLGSKQADDGQRKTDEAFDNAVKNHDQASIKKERVSNAEFTEEVEFDEVPF